MLNRLINITFIKNNLNQIDYYRTTWVNTKLNFSTTHPNEDYASCCQRRILLQWNPVFGSGILEVISFSGFYGSDIPQWIPEVISKPAVDTRSDMTQYVPGFICRSVFQK